MVGPSHSVDLKNYDALILVEIYRNVLGMSVIGGDFDKLKRFNLAEIWDPTPPPAQSVLNGKNGEVGDENRKGGEEEDGAEALSAEARDESEQLKTEHPSSEARAEIGENTHEAVTNNVAAMTEPSDS